MKCEIDIIMNRKQKWEFKSLLSKKGLQIREWFVEFGNNRTILSFEVEKEEKETLKEIFDFLKSEKYGSRVVLPNGKKLNPSKEEFDRFYKLVCEFIVKE